MQRVIKKYEQDIIKILNVLGIFENGKGVRYTDIVLNAFDEIKKYYTHVYSSYEEKYLDMAIKNLLPRLTIDLDEEELASIKSRIKK